MKKLKKTSCDLIITACVECPHCHHYFDLFDIQHLRDDGYIYEELLADDGFGHEDWNEEITCTHCSENFIVEHVNY